jgi:hypothetical protein
MELPNARTPAGANVTKPRRMKYRPVFDKGALARRAAPVGVHAVLGGFTPFLPTPATRSSGLCLLHKLSRATRK